MAAHTFVSAPFPFIMVILSTYWAFSSEIRKSTAVVTRGAKNAEDVAEVDPGNDSDLERTQIQDIEDIFVCISSHSITESFESSVIRGVNKWDRTRTTQ